MTDALLTTGIGVGVGVLYGAFGAGGSAFATPILVLAGVPPVVAVASPLPATIPAAVAGAWAYARRGDVACRLARRSIVAGIPATVLGALCSALVSGTALLVLSGVLLAVLGGRLMHHRPAIHATEGHETAAVAAAAAVGFAAGLLANGGGFLLVPVFLLIAGCGMRCAAGTSLFVAGALAAPTLLTHWALGHIDWTVAALLAVGLVPGTIAGSQIARLLPEERTQRVFGAVLVAFAAWFLVRL